MHDGSTFQTEEGIRDVTQDCAWIIWDTIGYLAEEDIRANAQNQLGSNWKKLRMDWQRHILLKKRSIYKITCEKNEIHISKNFC